MDLRVQKTENSIFEAFIELRSNKPLEKITVRELTELAKISKQTFYLHYRDIYDLSEHIENNLIDEMMKDLNYPNNMLEHLKQITIELFTRAISQGQLFKIVFSDSRVNALTDRIEKKLKHEIYKQYPELRADLKTNIYITVLVQGCYNAYQQYSTINQDRVVEILGEITDSITKRYLAR